MERERDNDNNSQLTTIVKTTTIKLSNFQFTKVPSPNSSYRGIISNNTKLLRTVYTLDLQASLTHVRLRLILESFCPFFSLFQKLFSNSGTFTYGGKGQIVNFAR